MPTTEPAQNQPTPRTDAAIVESILCTEGGDEECTVYPVVEHVEADFARTLEVEIAALTAKLALAERDSRRKDDALEPLAACANDYYDFADGSVKISNKFTIGDARKARAAMQPEGGK